MSQLMGPTVVMIPGGGGKSTLVSKYPDWLCDIDCFWDPTASTELEMIRQYSEGRAEGNRIKEASAIEACMAHKAHRAHQAAVLSTHIVLVQVPAQADLLLGDLPKGCDSRCVGLVPTQNLHEACMAARGDDERVKTICRHQRGAILASTTGTMQEYASFEALESAVLQLMASQMTSICIC